MSNTFCVSNVIHEEDHTICYVTLQQRLQIWHSTLCFLMWVERGAPAGSGQGSQPPVSLFTAAGWGFYCLKVRRNVHVLVFCGTLGFIAPQAPFLYLLVWQLCSVATSVCVPLPRERERGGWWEDPELLKQTNVRLKQQRGGEDVTAETAETGKQKNPSHQMQQCSYTQVSAGISLGDFASIRI